MQPVLASFYTKTRAARKIIVVDLGFLGDSVHLLPALREIKRHYPEAQLHTLSTPLGAEVVRLTPFVERAWQFPLGPPSPPWWRHWSLILGLRRERFDLAFNFSGADRTLFLTALTGAKWRVAHPGGRQHFWNTWLIPNWMPKQTRELPVFEQRRQALAACGLTLEPPAFGITLPEAARDWAAEKVPSEVIHLSINASTPLKEWPVRHWIALSQRLLAEFPTLALAATGSARDGEQKRLEQLAREVRSPRLKVFPPTLTIAQLAALLAKSRLHIGPDSGVLHLAMALGRPTLALFRKYSGAAEWLPAGPQHRHLLVPCECANGKAGPCSAKGEALCLAGIEPEKVRQLVWELIQSR